MLFKIRSLKFHFLIFFHLKADVVLLVTCSIREKAEQKIWSRLKSLKKLKHNHVTRQYPKIGVLGWFL